MTQPAVALDDPAILQARLRRFLNWLLSAFATIAVLMSIAQQRTPRLNGLLGTASVYGALLALLVARFALAKRPGAAVTTISVGFFCLAMADVVLLPRALPVMIFLPVMAIAVALPYLKERALRALSIAATVTTAAIASLSEFVKLFQPAAVRWLAMRAINADDQVPYERQAEYLLLARIRIAQEQQVPGSIDMDAVVRLLNRLLQAAEADERMSDRIAILALLALAYVAGRDPHQALASLAAALWLAEPEGYIRTFVDEGAPMRSLLIAQRAQVPESEAGTRLRTYIARLVDAFSPAVSAAPPSSPPQILLSERERTILQLLADGRSIQEIATLLVISAHTARTHVKHIYAKLDAHNRVQALDRARTLQLL